MVDLIIRNARIYDGSGKEPREGDVAVRAGKICGLHPEDDVQAEKTVDASGLCLAPGFIDSHSHGDLLIGETFTTVSKCAQGVTTHVGGQCGLSLIPTPGGRIGRMKDMMQDFDITPSENALRHVGSFGAFAGYVDSLSIPENLALMVGHGLLRAAAMDDPNAPVPAEKELAKMENLLDEAMQAGCLGMSSGLIYVPGIYAKPPEFADLCRTVARYGGVYATHMRNEADAVLQSIDETVETAKRSGVRAHISHVKVSGRPNWGISEAMLEKIEAARRGGVNLTCDIYPYTAGMTSLNVMIPPSWYSDGIPAAVGSLRDPESRKKIRQEMEEGVRGVENTYLNCGFDGCMILSAGKTPEASGKTVLQYAESIGADPFDALFDLLADNGCKGVMCIVHTQNEADMLNLLRDPLTAIGTDGIVVSDTAPTHPRSYGTFPRAIAHYARDRKILPVEEMVRKMTSLPADIYRLPSKGRIREGYDADLVLFSLEGLRDTPDYDNPRALPEGIVSVYTAGREIFRNGALTGEGPGKIVLRGNNR